eukprot:6196141-Pleurochrysis_carterae.AAC.8
MPEYAETLLSCSVIWMHFMALTSFTGFVQTLKQLQLELAPSWQQASTWHRTQTRHPEFFTSSSMGARKCCWRRRRSGRAKTQIVLCQASLRINGMLPYCLELGQVSGFQSASVRSQSCNSGRSLSVISVLSAEHLRPHKRVYVGTLRGGSNAENKDGSNAVGLYSPEI